MVRIALYSADIVKHFQILTLHGPLPDMPPAQMWLSAMMQFWTLMGPRLTWHTLSWQVLSETMGALTFRETQTCY